MVAPAETPEPHQTPIRIVNAGQLPRPSIAGPVGTVNIFPLVPSAAEPDFLMQSFAPLVAWATGRVARIGSVTIWRRQEAPGAMLHLVLVDDLVTDGYEQPRLEEAAMRLKTAIEGRTFSNLIGASGPAYETPLMAAAKDVSAFVSGDPESGHAVHPGTPQPLHPPRQFTGAQQGSTEGDHTSGSHPSTFQTGQQPIFPVPPSNWSPVWVPPAVGMAPQPMPQGLPPHAYYIQPPTYGYAPMPIMMTPIPPSPPGGPPMHKLPPNTQEKGIKLFVGMIPRNVDDDQLRKLAEEHGKVLEATILLDARDRSHKGCGFVQMATSEEAERCIQKLHGQFVFPHQRHGLNVRIAETSEEKARRLSTPRYSSSGNGLADVQRRL